MDGYADHGAGDIGPCGAEFNSPADVCGHRDRHTSHATTPISTTKGATHARDRVAGGPSSSRSVWSIYLAAYSIGGAA